MATIAVTTSTFGQYSREPLDMLDSAGFKVKLNPYGRTLTAKEAETLLQECVGVIAGTETLDTQVLSSLPELKVISRCGTGLDTVDLETAKHLNIGVFNTPDGPTQAVAELVVGIALSLLRHISLMDRELRQGIWNKRMGNLLTGKKIGIIGYGRIGKRVGILFRALGCEVACHDPFILDADIRNLPLNDLLEWCDCLTLHIPGQSNGYPLIGEKELKRMRKGSFLINASRGGLVEEESLYGVLKSGHMRGAAMDSFLREPYAGNFTTLDNVILTPHIGSYAEESRVKMEIAATENIIAYLTESFAN